MKSISNKSKLVELLSELEVLFMDRIITQDEYDCLKLILNHAYNSEKSMENELMFNPMNRFQYN